jgi:hypothetical protein
MSFKIRAASIMSLTLSYQEFHLTGSSAVLNGAKILFLATLIFA